MPGDVLLAIDTATDAVSVAVGPIDGPPTGLSVPTDRRHGEMLVPAIRDLLDATGIATHDVDGIVVGVGPGLFTGLRVGVTTAKTMARALRIPLVGVSSLAALAASVVAPRVAAVIDARRDEVFWACFQHGERRSPDRVDAPEVVAGVLEPPAVLAGDGAHRYANRLVRAGLTLSEVKALDPTALLELGAFALQRDGEADAGDVVPNYLRRTDAEIAWDRRSA